jgi:hypothetical protein
MTAGFHQPQHAVQFPGAFKGFGHAFGFRATQHIEIGTGEKAGFLARSDNRALDGVVAVQFGYKGLEVGDQGFVPYVHRYAGHVNGNEGDAVAIDINCECFVGHVFSFHVLPRRRESISVLL